MFFSRELVKSLRERPAVKEYLERENLRLDNLDSVSEIVKETRAGIVFETLIPKNSAVMKQKVILIITSRNIVKIMNFLQV